MEAAVSPDA